jgi:hypothetical protein
MFEGGLPPQHPVPTGHSQLQGTTIGDYMDQKGSWAIG